ncbi:MAG: 30S ribosomal protein S27e [Desulfurococcaceae archaeon]|nr:30S ribosomal protein S27e [Desulfurococcaceae archaeon]
MRKRKIPVPMPKSRFYKVMCKNCGAENIIFDRASFPTRCKVCGTQLVKPTGGRVEIINAEIIAELG